MKEERKSATAIGAASFSACAPAVEAHRPAIATELVRQHIDRATALLKKHDAGGLLFFRDTNIIAFCGVPLAPSDRLVCGLLNRDGRVAFVVPAFEAAMANELPPTGQLVPWEEHEDPYATVAKAARLLGLDAGTVLLDGHTWIDVQARLAAALPRLTLRPDPGVIEAVRIIKSPEEVDAIRSACRDTGRIYPLVGERLRPGLAEWELSQDVLHRLRRDGLSPFGDLIQGGDSAAIPHGIAGSRLFQEGDAVIVDFVCAHDGYLGDMTRTFAIGRPSEEIRQAYAVVREAHRMAIDAVRPGVTCESVDHVARTTIQRAGLGKYFVHRLGHGIGLDVHEPPYLVRGNSQLLAPGMCVTIEPGVYVPGRFGIRIEDTITITQDGCEILSNTVPTDVSPTFT